MSIKYIKCIANYFKVAFFKIQPITVSAILIFLSSYVSGNGWVNKWPRKTIPDFPYFGILSIVLTIIVLLFWIVSTHLFYLMKFSIVNEVDTFLTSLFIISATDIWIFSFSNNQAESIMMAITLLTGSIICCRIKKIYDTSISNEIFESNKLSSSLVDLRDLYNKSNVTQNEHGEILVDEREVDYDLFDRRNIVKQLTEAMQHPTSKHSYVIGLTGIWGSGKSTILNLAKKKINKDANSVDLSHTNKSDFDLWLFESKEEMIKGMYNYFLTGLGIQYRSALTNKLITSAAKLLAGISINGIEALFLDPNTYQDVFELKEKLTNYVKSANKHYVMCIENLDRADNEQVILILKLINSVFDIPNVTYVLLYDNDRLNKVLENTESSNVSFAEKVINQEIQMPISIDLDICNTCLNNLRDSYGMNNGFQVRGEAKDFQKVQENIVSNITTIRDLKRIINSVYTILANRDTLRLYLPDVIAIQYIHFKNPELYENIKDHKKLLTWTQSLYFNNLNNLTTEDRKYIEDLISNNRQYADMLKVMFPVITYVTQNIIEESCYGNYSSKRATINSEMFFDCYFNLAENDNTVENSKVKKFIAEVNQIGEQKGNNIKDDINKAWVAFITSINTDKNELPISGLSMFTDRDDIVSSQIRKVLSEVIFEYVIDNRQHNGFYWEDFIFIVSNLIKEVNKEDFNDFLVSEFSNRYDLLYIVNKINRDISESIGSLSGDLIRNRNTIAQFQLQMYKDIIAKSVNIFDGNGFYQNAPQLYNLMLNNKLVPEKVNAYLSKTVTSKSIFRFFGCLITNGENFKTIYYEMSSEEMGKIEDKLKCIPDLIEICKETAPKNKSQRIVQKVVNEYVAYKTELLKNKDAKINRVEKDRQIDYCEL
ncbi:MULTISPECIES: P-loop NTPase fold protein [Lactobacillus]|uniref:KAP NTPase domain-containing protein n=1 Tax=Lactobacillus xujianguonis TaxID=2495899 RepID=A0A437SU15_9LACO|nr:MULTISPECIES: P-loop NTPase fold protein [Lactobacillus]RVU70428.1 hypothetical protein EJK17_07450 [Lactobacillus xujianguonis]